MRFQLAVVSVLFVGSSIFPGSDAGMDGWFKGWGGGGGGKGKGGGGRGNRRPYSRPIYIQAPPMKLPVYQSPVMPSYGYGVPSNGISSFGKDSFSGSFNKGFSNIGLSSHGNGLSSGGYVSSYRSPAILTTSYSAPPVSYSAPASTTFIPAPSVTSTSHFVSSSKGDFGNLGGHGSPTGHGVTSYGAGSSGHGGGSSGHGGGSSGHGGSSFGHGGSSFGHGGSSSGHGGSSFGHGNEISHGVQKQGFGPIKNDDLINVQHSVQSGYAGENIHGMSAPQSLPLSSGPVKGGRQVSHEPPPVYVPGSGNSLGSGVSIHNNVVSDAGSLALQTEFNTNQFSAPHSAPLPMAEHGTSSISYLETPPAPLYSLDNSNTNEQFIGSGNSFNPSKQIPFPEDIGGEISYSSDVDTSHSSPAADFSAAPIVQSQYQSSGRGIIGQSGLEQIIQQAMVSFDHPLDQSDPIIEIVFEEGPAQHSAPAPAIDPSLYLPSSDDVEVYFIEVSGDEDFQTVDDLDLSSALAGVREEFPNGIPSELSQTLIDSGYLDNAQIEVLDLQSALGNNQLDKDVRLALQDAYGSESKTVATVVEAPEDQEVEMTLKRLLQGENTVLGDVELAKDLSERFRTGRYGGVVELNDDESEQFLPLQVDGQRIPIPDHPELRGRKISGVLVYANEKKGINSSTDTKANIILNSSRRGRQLFARTKALVQGDTSGWKPILKNEKS